MICNYKDTESVERYSVTFYNGYTRECLVIYDRKIFLSVRDVLWRLIGAKFVTHFDNVNDHVVYLISFTLIFGFRL